MGEARGRGAAAFPRRRGLGGGVMAHVARGLKRIPYMFFNSLADTDCDSDGPVIVPAAVGCAESFNSPPPPTVTGRNVTFISRTTATSPPAATAAVWAT